MTHPYSLCIILSLGVVSQHLSGVRRCIKNGHFGLVTKETKKNDAGYIYAGMGGGGGGGNDHREGQKVEYNRWDNLMFKLLIGDDSTVMHTTINLALELWITAHECQSSEWGCAGKKYGSESFAGLAGRSLQVYYTSKILLCPVA